MSDLRVAPERLERPRRASNSGKPRPVAICPECGASYAKLRKHQTFCLPKCRKAFWVKERTARPAYDIRTSIAKIAADVAAIRVHLGIEKEGV